MKIEIPTASELLREVLSLRRFAHLSESDKRVLVQLSVDRWTAFKEAREG